MSIEAELEKLREALAAGTSILFPEGCASIITESWEQLGFHSHTVQMALLGYRSRDAEVEAKDAEIARLKALAESYRLSMVRRDDEMQRQADRANRAESDKVELVEGLAKVFDNLEYPDLEDDILLMAEALLAKHRKAAG